MKNQMSGVVSLADISPAKKALTGDIIIGKDVLELLTGAMYTDPLSIFREYIQNSTDSIDDAVANGIYLQSNIIPQIDINLNGSARSILIRDNGLGISNKSFKRVLTSIGGSHKRGTHHRGFRGVGRLSGLGYCQEVVFRSRSLGDEFISELRWDARRLKTLLNDSEWEGDLKDIVKEVAVFSKFKNDKLPSHFFEVELNKVLRFKNDLLLNEEVVRKYIGEICPVPFAEDFRFGNKISEFLSAHGVGQTYDIFINGASEQIRRPHLNSFNYKQDSKDSFDSIDLFKLEGINGEVDAIGWKLEHSYFGALPKPLGLHGVRLRSGNTQVGSAEIVSEIFPESRFNSWTVCEVQILNSKITPNGRRDHFEQNAHFMNLVGQLAPLGKQVAHQCRYNSSKRNNLKVFELEKAKANEIIEIVEHKATPVRVIKKYKEEFVLAIAKMKKVISMDYFKEEEKENLKFEVTKLEEKFISVPSTINETKELSFLPKGQQVISNEIFELIYDNYSSNKNAAKTLVDKLVKQLAARYKI